MFYHVPSSSSAPSGWPVVALRIRWVAFNCLVTLTILFNRLLEVKLNENSVVHVQIAAAHAAIEHYTARLYTCQTYNAYTYTYMRWGVSDSMGERKHTSECVCGIYGRQRMDLIISTLKHTYIQIYGQHNKSGSNSITGAPQYPRIVHIVKLCVRVPANIHTNTHLHIKSHPKRVTD